MKGDSALTGHFLLTDEGFRPVARLSELREGHARKVEVDDLEVALWRVGGRVYAIGNVCAHQHFSLLHQGILEGLTVGCPMHGWRYSLETGLALEGSGRVPVYRVMMKGDTVLVSLAAEG